MPQIDYKSVDSSLVNNFGINPRFSEIQDKKGVKRAAKFGIRIAGLTVLAAITAPFLAIWAVAKGGVLLNKKVTQRKEAKHHIQVAHQVLNKSASPKIEGMRKALSYDSQMEMTFSTALRAQEGALKKVPNGVTVREWVEQIAEGLETVYRAAEKEMDAPRLQVGSLVIELNEENRGLLTKMAYEVCGDKAEAAKRVLCDLISKAPIPSILTEEFAQDFADPACRDYLVEAVVRSGAGSSEGGRTDIDVGKMEGLLFHPFVQEHDLGNELRNSAIQLGVIDNLTSRMRRGVVIQLQKGQEQDFGQEVTEIIRQLVSEQVADGAGPEELTKGVAQGLSAALKHYGIKQSPDQLIQSFKLEGTTVSERLALLSQLHNI